MTFLRSLLFSGAALMVLAACTNTKLVDEPISAADVSAALLAAADRAKATTGTGRPALWSISDDDTVVYLFGTIHLLRPETDWRTPAFEQAFAAADTLYLEVDNDSADGQAEVLRLLKAKGSFQGDNTLDDVLDDSEESRLNTIIEPMSLSLEKVNRVKPWLLGLQISISSIVQAGYDSTKGVDAVLGAEARRSGKVLKFLETAEQQILLLSDAPLKEQVDGLMVILETLSLGTEFVDILAIEWADGDVKGLAATMSDPAVFGSKDAYDRILVQRNRDWIPALVSALNEPGVKFVAVGAGHMVGPDSVIAMLAAQGLNAERVQ